MDLSAAAIIKKEKKKNSRLFANKKKPLRIYEDQISPYDWSHRPMQLSLHPACGQGSGTQQDCRSPPYQITPQLSQFSTSNRAIRINLSPFVIIDQIINIIFLIIILFILIIVIITTLFSFYTTTISTITTTSTTTSTATTTSTTRTVPTTGEPPEKRTEWQRRMTSEKEGETETESDEPSRNHHFSGVDLLLYGYRLSYHVFPFYVRIRDP